MLHISPDRPSDALNYKRQLRPVSWRNQYQFWALLHRLACSRKDLIYALLSQNLFRRAEASPTRVVVPLIVFRVICGRLGSSAALAFPLWA